MPPLLEEVAVTLIGHPFAPIGMGEQMRSHVAAMDALGLRLGILDVFRHAARGDDAHAMLVGEREIARAPEGVRILHINGDEVPRAVAALAGRGTVFEHGYNIVVPAWELPAYPPGWAAELARFDEVWAISRFVQSSLAAGGVASHLVGQAVEPAPGPLLPRRWFGIRESAFVLLVFLDLTSYASRKNPEAALDLFARLRTARPWADLHMVLKVKDGARAALNWRAEADPGILRIDQPLDSVGVKSLIAACDCFVSLHRAEGFGRGLGEAMALGRLAVGTGWSGNLDFMDAENSILADAKLTLVPRGAYPFARGQSWAEPDVGSAVEPLLACIDDRAQWASRAERGRGDVLRSHGNRAVGLRILDRLERIAAGLPRADPAPS